MIGLYPFQQRAVAQIADRFATYWSNRPGRVLGSQITFLPFYQALASITASGKTVMMCGVAAEALAILPVPPIVIWVSKGRVVVDQTYTNLSDGGKYRHLLSGYEVRLLGEFDPSEAEEPGLALVYLATVGTFNQKSRDQGNLRLFRSDIDNAEQSTWVSLRTRLNGQGVRRPLLIIYDEAHNLTDQQTDLLMELEPDALFLASATHRLPRAILKVTNDLKTALNWSDAQLTTYVSSRDVVEAGLVKKQILLGGYQADMAEAIDDLMQSLAETEHARDALSSSILPKAIYVCKTNIVEGNAFQRDDPKRPFAQRQAPPILIWRYLVENKAVDPLSIAVYTTALQFDPAFPAPAGFVHFKGGDADYTNFTNGKFRHIIFNLGLQEGWDDPECYFAYIDKSMSSNVQVEQVIGRVLRQPNQTHLASDLLNTAQFFVRVDKKGVFAEIVREVGRRLGHELPEVRIAAYEARTVQQPRLVKPKVRAEVPHVYRDPSQAVGPIDVAIREMVDFRGVVGPAVQGGGAKALVQQQIGSGETVTLEWVERDHSNPVSARWIFQNAVRRQFPLALEVTPSDSPKFDALVEIGSQADAHIRATADRVVSIYLDRVVLRQRLQFPYVVGEMLIDPLTERTYQHGVHEAYSGLNQTLEQPFADELDRTGVLWCRNPSRSGFGIPLMTLGQSRTFYPDFLAWEGNRVFALDTKGEHILSGELGRKLLAVAPHPQANVALVVRFVSPGQWSSPTNRDAGDGFTVWSLGPGHELRAVPLPSLGDAVAMAITNES